MRRVFEIAFRHPLRLLVLLVVLPAVGFGITYTLPRSYQSAADLWALQRYVVIGATGAETDLLATPSETQATALQELLQSRAFALQVAHATPLPSTMSASVGGNPQLLDDALYTDISTHVQVTPQGYNLYTITYTNRDPYVAQQVVQSVIQTFGNQSVSFSVVEGQKQLDALNTQLANAQKDANAAAVAEAKYIADHPQLSRADLNTDPQYLVLHSQTLQAQANVQNIETNIATLQQSISQSSNVENLFLVLDPPVQPIRAVSRVKILAIGGGGGLVVGLLACALYLALLLRRNRAIYDALDIQRVTAVPVILELPVLSATTATLSMRLLQSGGPPTDRKGRR